MSGTASKAKAQKAETPLFEAWPKNLEENLYGRYRVITSAYPRRFGLLFFPVVAVVSGWQLLNWLEEGGKMPPVTGHGRHRALAPLIWPLTPVLSPLFIIGWPVIILSTLSERRYFWAAKKGSIGRGNLLNLNTHHLARVGERTPARIEAHATFIDVCDNYNSILVPDDQPPRRSNWRGKSWIRFRYDQIVCAWYAPDLIILRFCWGSELDEVWDVLIDRSSFTKGDAESFIKHIEPFYKFKRTSYRLLWGKARWSSPWASPNIYFRQRMTKIYRVRWPRRKRKAKQDEQ